MAFRKSASKNAPDPATVAKATRKAILVTPEQVDDERIPRGQRIGAAIHRAMVARGLTQTELARLAGQHLPKVYQDKAKAEGREIFGRWLVTNYISGRNIPRQVHLEALAKALDVKMEDLAGEADVKVIGKKADTLILETISGDRMLVRIDTVLPVDVALEVAQLIRTAKK